MLVPTVGIEVHAELRSKTKVFSDSKNAYENIPNLFVNEIDLGYPGTLPKLNQEVIHMALKASLALHCEINTKMHFDRKNYFYPDLPKGYQITQSATPIGHDGYLEIEVDGNIKRIGIERVHIEEDTCKSIHSMEGTLLNFNRAGVPLIEIVSKPDIASDKEAVAYLDTLRETLLYLGISDVKIEEGSMRCDANVSLSEEGSGVLGTKTEVKNIGSIRNVGTSIRYETCRQKELLEKGETIQEETRRFDDKTESTILMRIKETGNDYRYFPEPDLPFLYLTKEEIEKTRRELPILPSELRKKYTALGMNEVTLRNIIANHDLCLFLEELGEGTDLVIAANLLTGDIISYLNKNNLTLEQSKMTVDHVRELVQFLQDKKISSKQSKEIIPIVLEKGTKVSEIIEKEGMQQITDTGEIAFLIENILQNNSDSITDYKAGKDRAVKYLMGQIMKESKGKVSPEVASKLLMAKLEEM